MILLKENILKRKRKRRICEKSILNFSNSIYRASLLCRKDLQFLNKNVCVAHTHSLSLYNTHRLDLPWTLSFSICVCVFLRRVRESMRVYLRESVCCVQYVYVCVRVCMLRVHFHFQSERERENNVRKGSTLKMKVKLLLTKIITWIFWSLLLKKSFFIE